MLGVEPSDRAPANPDLEDVDDVAANGKTVIGAADMVDRFHRVAAALDQCAFRRGAAHVEGDEIVDAEDLTVARGSDATSDRSGFDERDRLPAAAFGRDDSAMRSHQQQRAFETAAAQTIVEFGHVFADLRPDISVGGSRGGALELVPFAGQLGAGSNEHAPVTGVAAPPPPISHGRA